MLEFLFNKVAGQLYLKKTQVQVLSCEICEILKSIYFEEHRRTTASDLSRKDLMQEYNLSVSEMMFLMPECKTSKKNI